MHSYVRINLYDQDDNFITSHNVSAERLKASPVIILPAKDRASRYYKQGNKNTRKYDYIEFTPVYL